MSAFLAEQDELGVLGACLLGGLDASSDAIASVPGSMVVSDQVRESLEVIESMVRSGIVPTLETLHREWRRSKGKADAPIQIWNQALDACPSAGNLAWHAEAVRDAYLRRKFREASSKLAADCGDPSVSIQQVISNLEAGIAIDQETAPKTATAKEAVREFIDDAQERFQRKGQLSGITTGIHRLDRMTDGIQPGELFLVAARPSIGKTAMAVSIAEAACIRGQIPTLFVTCEMSKKALMRRLTSTVGKIPMQNLKTGEMTEGDFRALSSASARISKSPLHFLDVSGGANVATITAEARRAVRKHGVRLVIVDYLQKVQASIRNEKRTYEVADVSSKLKGFAAATGASMLCLAQLNRESEKEKNRKPKLSDLADSGQIERDADTVCLLDRNRGETRGEATLIIAKQRDGECGAVKLWYEGQFCQFTENNNIE